MRFLALVFLCVLGGVCAANNNCPDGRLKDEYNQQPWGRGLCSPKNGNRAYLGVAGGGQRAKTFAQGLFRGMHLLAPGGTDEAIWPDNVGGNSGGTWAMMEFFTWGPVALFDQASHFGRYVNPQNFSSMYQCMKDKWEDRRDIIPLYTSDVNQAVLGLHDLKEVLALNFRFRKEWYEWMRYYFYNRAMGFNKDTANDKAHVCKPMGPRTGTDPVRSYPLMVSSGTNSYERNLPTVRQIVYSEKWLGVRSPQTADWGGNHDVTQAGTHSFSDPGKTYDGSYSLQFWRTTKQEFYESQVGLPWCSGSARSSCAPGQVTGSFAMKGWAPDLRFREKVKVNGQEKMIYAFDGGYLDNNGVMPAFSMRAERIVHETISDLAMTPDSIKEDLSNAKQWNIFKYTEKCYQTWTGVNDVTQLDTAEKGLYDQHLVKEGDTKLLSGTVSRDNYQLFDISFDSDPNSDSRTGNNGMFKKRYHCAMVNEWKRTNYDNADAFMVTMALTVQPTKEAIEFWGLATTPNAFQEYDVIYTQHYGAPMLGWEKLVGPLQKEKKSIIDLKVCGKYTHNGAGDTQLKDHLNTAQEAITGTTGRKRWPHTATQMKITPACTAALLNMATYAYLSGRRHFDFSLNIADFDSKVTSGTTDPKYAEVIDCRKKSTSTKAGLKKCLDGYKPLRPAGYVAPSAIIDKGRNPFYDGSKPDCTPDIKERPKGTIGGAVAASWYVSLLSLLFFVFCGCELGS